MTLDDLPFDLPEADATRPERASRKCRRHGPWIVANGITSCDRCGHVQDPVAARRGRSSRRLGSDQERRIERVYGPTKIGERGDPVDHLGRLGKWQSKATRGAVPRWLADPMRKMAGLYGDRVPLLILSFVRQGLPTEDYVVVSGRDWLALHGRDSDEEIQPADPYPDGLISNERGAA